MKLICKIFSALIIVSCISCNGIILSQQDKTLTDSLIIITRINDKTLMTSFGSDAVVFVRSDSSIVVIDAGISTGLTNKYRKLAESEFGDIPFEYVINTHGHHDHYRGNNVFGEAKVIGHINMGEEIDSQWKSPEKVAIQIKKIVEEYEAKLAKAVAGSDEWKDSYIGREKYSFSYKDAVNFLPVIKPGITFSDSLNISVGDIDFEMIYFGKCHSKSDILIYVPQLNILFTGDLFSKYGRADLNHENDKENWNRSAEWINKRMFNINTVIGGHGQLLTKDDLESFIKTIKAK